mgnify:CR=1 FL=1
MTLPFCITAVLACLQAGATTAPATRPAPDLRNIRTGLSIPDEGYCDQPYIVITQDGHWLCTMTTGKGEEGDPGQHIIATISTDKGRTWSKPVDIEPADGPEASWAMPLVTPTGRVYVFYDYNGDRVSTLGDKKNIRADMLGWFVYKYSDDNGRTWSPKRYRLPVRITEFDRNNDWKGQVQMLWGIGKPIIAGQSVYLGFSKIGKYLIDTSEGWFFRSDNLLAEPDPDKHVWEMLPEGDVGLRSPEGPIAEEHNLVALSDGSLYAVYRTVAGFICHAYSRDGGRTWTPPAFAAYTPGGRPIKNPRACPRLWKTLDGKYLLWYHNHGGKDFTNRNPAWITGGVEKDGFIHWAQPEILLYDPNPSMRMSYPDLIQQDGRYWITQTNKTVARVHEIDSSLLEGLWNQGADRTISRPGLILELNDDAGLPDEVPMPDLPRLADGGGFTLEAWIHLTKTTPGQIICASRDAQARKGIMLSTAPNKALRFTMSDEISAPYWDTEPNLIRTDELLHIVVIVDGGPHIISVVVNGVLCDGGTARQYGWGRFTPEIGDVNGSATLHIAPKLEGKVLVLRLYDRYLRTSQAVAHYAAGPR